MASAMSCWCCVAWVGFWLCFVPRAVVGDRVRPVLRFNSDGAFKILQVADMHFAQGAQSQCFDVRTSHHCSDLNTTLFIERLLAAEKPDLVVFTGDNIDGSATDAIKSMDQAFAPVIAAKIPWAATLGNHDQESNLPRAKVMDYLTQMDYSVSDIVNPSMATLLGKSNDRSRASIEVHGYGNYYLQVFGALGSDSANSSLLNLYFLDSGDHSKFDIVNGYDWVRASQLLWFETLAAKLRSSEALANTGSPPPVTPALAFFHIPIPEYNAAYMSPSVVGVKQEVVSSASVNSGLFTSLVEAGDVKATFVGHDHVNDYCGSLLGIQLCYGGGIGYHAYGKAGWARRARVVLVALGKGTKDGSLITREISSWKRLDNEYLSKTDIQNLYNGYAGEWFSRPMFGIGLSFGRSGDNWIPSVTVMLLLTGLAGSSFLVYVLVRKFQTRKRTTRYASVEGASPIASYDVCN